MTEHELTEEKIAELYDNLNRAGMFTRFDDLKMRRERREAHFAFARAAYDLGKQAATEDGFIDCERDDIRKGETVERTVRYAHGTVATTVGVAGWFDLHDNWRDSDGILLTSDNADATYRRKPAPVIHPDPEKHPVILDEDGDAWVWRPIAEKYECLAIRAQSNPEHFGNNWRPAKVVAKEED